MKNIFLYDKINAQNEQSINNLTVNQSLTLTGANQNELLIIGANSNVQTFNNGPARSILEIDAATNRPAWTNNISIDFLTTNDVRINGLQRGDLLVSNDNTGLLDRLPRGPQGNVLVSDDNNPQGLNYATIPQILNLPKGNVFCDATGNLFTDFPATGVNNNVQSLGLTETGLLTVLKVFFPNRLYKISASWNNAINGNSSNLYTLDVNGYRESFLCQARSSRENMTILFSSQFLIDGFAQLIGSRNPNTPADINTSSGAAGNITLIVECLADI